MKLTLSAILLTAVMCAQGPQGPRGPAAGPGNAAGSGLDMSKQTTIEGTVAAVRIASGAQYPTIEIAGKQIKVAPPWFLLENDFEVRQGDTLKVTAAPGIRDSFLYAVTLTKPGGASLELRDAQGFPVWAGPRGSGPQDNAGQGGAGSCTGSCLEPGSTSTLAGTVVEISSGAGIQHPSLVLKKSDGALVSIVLGPERILLSRDFEIKPGDALTVTAAQPTACEYLIALEITDAQGRKVVLRTPEGRPAW